MTFVPSTPRTEEEIEATFRKLLAPKIKQEPKTKPCVSIVEIPEGYVVKKVGMYNTIKNVTISKDRLGNGVACCQKEMQKSKRYTTHPLYRSGQPTSLYRFHWKLPSVTDIAQLITGIYQEREKIAQSEKIRQLISLRLDNGPYITSTLIKEKRDKIIVVHDVYLKEKSTIVDRNDTKGVYTALLGVEEPLFSEAAEWFTGRKPELPYADRFKDLDEPLTITLNILGRSINIQPTSCDSHLKAMGMKIRECK